VSAKCLKAAFFVAAFFKNAENNLQSNRGERQILLKILSFKP
jgi:hypothetical protein